MKALATFAACALLASPALAAPVSWVDWTTANSNTATGTLTVGVDTITVGVSATENFHFTQTSGGTNYWTNPDTYTGGVLDSAPPTSDIIALGANSTVTLTFSQAIENIYIALVSWNIDGIVFSDPVSILSIGPGFWGSGTGTVSSDGLTVDLSGEMHGTLEVLGTLSTFSFTHGSEVWHGFTIGVAGVAPPPPPPIPLPAALPLMLLALGGLGLAARRRKA